MAGLSNKISNIIGTKIPTYIFNQLLVRSAKNSLQTRDSDNVRYLANKSAWIRLVSSVNIAKEDIAYFNRLGANISNQDDLAKNYVLFAGTSKYKGANNRNVPSYDIRSGIKNDGAYNLLNDKEINDYGYRPMPGITSVNVETQGALGSVRSATINFKVWDKDQLDIMDALYFKLGFTMFLEWGNTFFYKGVDSITSKQVDNTLHSTEDYSIDPFSAGLTKEDLNYKIGQNIIDTEGNYDAILGVVSNFNFSFNQEGGYDCTLKLMALGYLGDSIKINHSAILPNILEQEIKQVETILSTIEAQKAKEAKDKLDNSIAEKLAADLQGKKSLLHYLNFIYNKKDNEPYEAEILGLIDAIGIKNSFQPANVDKTTESTLTNKDSFDFLDNDVLYLQKFGVQIPKDKTESFIKTISLNKDLVLNRFNAALGTYIALPYEKRTLSGGIPISTPVEYILANEKTIPPLSVKQAWSKLLKGIETGILTYVADNSNLRKNMFSRFYAIPAYSGNNNDSYNIYIKITLPNDVRYVNTDDRFKSVLANILNKESFNFTKFYIETNEEDPRKFYLVLTGESEFLTSSIVKKENVTYEGIKYTDEVTNSSVPSKASFSIIITDTALISNIEANISNKDALFTDYIKKLSAQDQIQQTSAFEDEHEGDVTSLQNKIGTFYNSSLEIILRTIQIHCFGKAIQKNGSDINKEVFPVPLAEDDIRKQIFSNGIFANSILDQLIYNKIDDNAYINTPSNPEARLKVFCKYGFNTDLLANKIKVQDLKDKQVDYAGLLMCYVVPYEINNQLEVGISLTHPVYMQFGLLLMILNHMCTIYDRKKGPSNEQTPLVYIDFNPNTNFCLSNNKHLSTDPFSFLIPIQGDISKNYPELFDSSILTKDKKSIAALDEKDQKIPETKLFSADDNIISGQIPQFKVDPNNASRGSTMNILLSIEYILNLVKQYSTKDEKGSVYLKPFLEQIISDMNKSFGNFNLFRLAYNDAANTYHIIDDQFVPGTEKDDYIPKDGTTDLPLYGLNSIAKTLEIKTDISTKLANMVAISSNADSKYANSTNATDLGLINTGYTDRYINNKTEISNEKEKEKSNSNAAVINSAIKFDKTIKEFYGSISPSTDTVSFATNYYINKMSKVKSEEIGSRASALIPVSINFTTDGISGMNIGQGFTIPDKFLPYTYNERKVVNGALRKVGFVILGAQQSFEANQWNTSIRANMIFLKDKDDFNSSVANQYSSVKEFKGTPTESQEINYSGHTIAKYDKIKFLDTVDITKIKDPVLKDVNDAAKAANVVVTIGFGVEGHSKGRHPTGNAVDIDYINGLKVSKANQALVEKFTNELLNMKYSKNLEIGYQKAFLTFEYVDKTTNKKTHENHVHVSNNAG
jgi:hypothetical protein